MRTCCKCGGTEIVKGKIRRSSEEFFSDIVFGPDGTRRFFALTFEHGTKLQEESCALSQMRCGLVSDRPRCTEDFYSEALQESES